MDLLNRIFRLDNRLYFNARIIVPITLLCIIGLIALRSTSIDTLGVHSVFHKQFIWILFSSIIFIIIQFIRGQILYEFSYILYTGLILTLILTHFMPEINSSSRWIIIGSIQFQPSEIGKIILILCLSRFLSDYKDTFTDHQIIILSGIIILIPALLIAKQPDYGTSLIYILPLLPMLYWANIKVKSLLLYIFPIISILAASKLIVFTIWMAILIIILLVLKYKLNQIIIHFSVNSCFGLLTDYVWDHVLQPYHIKRIMNIISPSDSDALGIGYQLFQSKVAIGSGGILGKGLGEGTQSYLRFLPIKDSDFILSVISEEMGLFAILLISITFIFFFYYTIDYAQRIFNKFHSLNIIGFSFILFFHMLINMCMVVGLFPVIGLPFPFISYGGTFILSCFIIIAIINSTVNNDL